MTPSSAVVIVNWNAADVLAACLDSIGRQRMTPRPRVVVVDNASSDHSREVLRRYADRVELHLQDTNLGFGRANNLGARDAAEEVLIFLNPDTELVGDSALERLVREAADRRAGIVAPRLLNPDRSVQQSCASIPGIATALMVGTGIHKLFPDRLRARWSPVSWSHDHTRETGWVSGAAVAMRADLFRELGGWSEATFMYAEDLDLSYRVRRAGRPVRYTADVEVVHHDNHSSSQRWSDAERNALVVRSELAFMRAHYSLPHRLLTQALMAIAFGARAVALRRRLPQRATVYRSMARAYLRPGADGAPAIAPAGS